jgi:hypothetical protein
MAAYVKGWPDTHVLKARLMELESASEVRALFAHYLSTHPDQPRVEGDDWIGRYLPLDRDWMPKTRLVTAL